MQEPSQSPDEHLRDQQPSRDRRSDLAELNNSDISQPLPTTPPPPGRRRCRFFFGGNNKNKHNGGCRAGAACPFSHDASAGLLDKAIVPTQSHNHHSPFHPTSDPYQGKAQVSHELSHTVGTATATEKWMLRPIPESERADPRQFQLNQVRRRFSPEEKEDGQGTVLTFRLTPTDPDFPFEMADLHCTLLVPLAYPNKGRPSLRVTNPEMDRGYQINIERGFDSLVAAIPKSTLLVVINELDKRLESFLTSVKAQTIKLVANRGKERSGIASAVPVAPAAPVAFSSTREAVVSGAQAQHTPQQAAEAKAKRESDVGQLQARMGRQNLFSESPDGLSFTVPLQISKSSKVPIPLQSVQSVRLFVPSSYNLVPCSISFVGAASAEAKAVEAAFERRSKAHLEMSLMAHVNYLAQNMQSMAMDVPAPAPEITSPLPCPDVSSASLTSKNLGKDRAEDRPHVQIIPRPPEWNAPRDVRDLTDSSDAYDSGDGSEEDMDNDDGGAGIPSEAQVTSDPDPGPDLGILLSFPSLELYGIELLQLYSLSVTVKCDRCHDMTDVKNIKTHAQGDKSPVRHESCKKCANQLNIGYRAEPLHSNSVRAGYLDLDGCIIVDLLPSNFIPTCSQCSTSQPAPGVVSFRGESTMAICRDCHQKMSFKIPDVKFLRVSAGGTIKSRPMPKRRPKETLGIVSGQELARRGRCEHYAKSYRWFRFSCCSKVYPCDRCHDGAEEHPNEHANRMICGFCSREQVYRPEDCIHCHHSLIRRHGGGFWEGGKGTRDKVKMSRKDPRKYKRRPGGTVGGGNKK